MLAQEGNKTIILNNNKRFRSCKIRKIIRGQAIGHDIMASVTSIHQIGRSKTGGKPIIIHVILSGVLIGRDVTTSLQISAYE